MDSLTVEQQQKWGWKVFFVYAGIMTLVFWNSILNLTLYYNQKIEEGFFVYITFAFTFGSITSFLTSRTLFKHMSSRKQILFFIILSCLSFTAMGLMVELVPNIMAKKVLSIAFAIINGYVSGCYQGKLSGFSSVCGPQTITYFNVGTGISGFSTNIMAIIFTFIFPTTEDLQLGLQRQLIGYLVILNIIFAFFIVVLFRFLRRYGHFVDELDQSTEVAKLLMEEEEDNFIDSSKPTTNENSMHTLDTTQRKEMIDNEGKSFTTWKTRNSEPPYGVFSVIKRIIDLWSGIIFLYYFTLQVVCFFVANLTEKYDNSNNLYMLAYFFLYNLGDTLGKMIPPKFNIKSSFLLHFFNLGRTTFQIYFLFLIFTIPWVFFYHYVTRGAIYLLLGLSNGYFTNVFFCHSADRFRNPKNKDFSGFMIVFGLIMGVTLGTLSGILWSI